MVTTTIIIIIIIKSMTGEALFVTILCLLSFLIRFSLLLPFLSLLFCSLLLVVVVCIIFCCFSFIRPYPLMFSFWSFFTSLYNSSLLVSPLSSLIYLNTCLSRLFIGYLLLSVNRSSVLLSSLHLNLIIFYITCLAAFSLSSSLFRLIFFFFFFFFFAFTIHFLILFQFLNYNTFLFIIELFFFRYCLC